MLAILGSQLQYLFRLRLAASKHSLLLCSYLISSDSYHIYNLNDVGSLRTVTVSTDAWEDLKANPGMSVCQK